MQVRRGPPVLPSFRWTWTDENDRRQEDCIPATNTFHDQISKDPATRWESYPTIIEDLKKKARSLGLWNLFLMKEHYPDVGVPLTNLEYAIMAEIMGRAPRVAPEACNCAFPLVRRWEEAGANDAVDAGSAPDTGNMEVLARYGTQEQKDKWLVPLLEGRARSSFAMTEKGVASSEYVPPLPRFSSAS